MKYTSYQLKAIIFLVFLVAGNGSVSHSQSQNAPQLLQPNEALEREMTGGDAHRYRVDLKANEFFQVRVEQKGVDVALKLLDASGNVVATMDSPNGQEGFEVLSFVATQAGEFVLEVGNAAAKVGKASYKIKREVSRIATGKDSRRVAVERAFVEGIKARDTEGQAELGIAKLEEALKGWQELEESYLIELTTRSVSELKENKHYATFVRLHQELQKANELLDEGAALSFKSKADSPAGRAKLTEALTRYRAFGEKVNDKIFVEKIQQASKSSQRPMQLLINLQYYAKQLETHCLDRIGQTYYNLSEWEEYINYKKLTLAGYQEIITNKTLASAIKPQNLLQSKLIEALTLNQIGSALDGYFGKSEEALNYLNQSLERTRALYEETQDPRVKLWEAAVLRQMAFIYGKESRNNSKSIEFFTKALEIYRSAPDKKDDEAGILFSVAVRYMLNFQYKEAKINLEGALQLYRATDYKSGQSQVLGVLGVMSGVLNNKSEVSKYFNQNLLILQSPDYAESYKKYFTRKTGSFEGLEVYKELNDARIEYERLSSIGLTYRWLDDYPKALEYYEKTLAVARSRKEPRDIRQSLIDVGYTLGKLKKWKEAVSYYEQALEMSRQQGAREDIARDLQDVGLAWLEAGKPQEALTYQNESLITYQSVGVDEDKAFTPAYSALLNELGRSYYALGNRPAAIFYGKKAINAMQGERQRLQNLDLMAQKGFLEKKEQHYRRLADWLIEAGRFAQGEQVLRMLKEEEYSDFVRRDSDEIKNLNQHLKFEGKDKEIVERYNQLSRRVSEIGEEYFKLDEKQRQLTRKKSPVPVDEQKRHAELYAQLNDANAAFKLFLDKVLVSELGQEKKEGIEVDRSLQEDLRKWGDGTVMLYTVVGEDRYRVILTTPTIQVDGKYEIKAAELNKKIFAFRDALQNPKVDPRPLGKELHDILIKPIEKDLQAVNAKTLIWSLDGTLRYVPLAALSPDGKSYLVEKYQNAIITPKASREFSSSRADWRALGLGVSQHEAVTDPDNPHEKINFKGLPGTKIELMSIVKDEDSQSETGLLLGKRFVDEGFTAQNFINSLRDETEDGARKYTVIHIASHFHLGSNWTNSFLLLGNGKILSLQDISSSPGIRFGDVELITLSACNTAFADQANGKEVDSLAEAIQNRGGKAVLATLWGVADASTSLLMTEFYRLRKENPKLTKAGALRRAQQEMLAGRLKASEAKSAQRNTSETDVEASPDYSHPYHWSPFILIGNWK